MNVHFKEIAFAKVDNQLQASPTETKGKVRAYGSPALPPVPWASRVLRSVLVLTRPQQKSHDRAHHIF